MYSVSFNGYTLTDYNPTAQGHFACENMTLVSLSQLLHQFKPVISYCNLKRTIPFHIYFQGQFIENLYYGSPAVLIPYDLVRKVVLLSLSCEYVLKIECHAAVDSYSWWVNHYGAKVTLTASTGTFCKTQGKYGSHPAYPKNSWRHQMEIFSTLLAICEGNSPVTGEFSSQRPVTRSFDVFFDLRLNKGWVNNRDAVDMRRHSAHYDANVIYAHVLCVVVLCQIHPRMSPYRLVLLHLLWDMHRKVSYG